MKMFWCWCASVEHESYVFRNEQLNCYGIYSILRQANKTGLRDSMRFPIPNASILWAAKKIAIQIEMKQETNQQIFKVRRHDQDSWKVRSKW